MEPRGIWWKSKLQQPQVATREIPTGCEGVVELERVQQVAQKDCVISILKRPRSLAKQGPDWATWSKFEDSLALGRRLAKELSRGPFQVAVPFYGTVLPQAFSSHQHFHKAQ